MRLIKAVLSFYIIGIVILTLGIVLTIQSSLGTSPFDAFLVGLTRTFGLTIGTWEIVVGSAMVFANALALKKKPEYGAIITSFVTGIGIDFWLLLLGDWAVPATMGGQFMYLCSGLIFSCIGVAIYLQSSFAPNPMDRPMLVVSKLTGWSVTYSRALINIALVITAYFFGGAIGLGTLVNALISGILISFFLSSIAASRVKESESSVRNPAN